VIRQAHLIAVVGAFLIAGVVVGCASAQGNIDDERGGEEGAAVTNEETTAPKGDRSVAATAQEELVDFDEEVVSPPSQANEPRDFGEGSLWAIRYPVLKRVDPQTGEVVAEIPLKPFNDTSMQVAFGAGSVWVSSGNYDMGPPEPRGPGDVVLRIDPQTNRVVDRIPVDPPSGLAFGHGSVWATSAGHGTLSRIDPQTGEVVAKIDVGRAPVDVAVDESSGAVWVASVDLPNNYGGYGIPQHSEDRNLTRVDPETNRVVAEIPIGADEREAERITWLSAKGRCG
jgi:YVTN family beta-propeller protein